jgi:oxygen-independent coproporphyrinogen III oxidase
MRNKSFKKFKEKVDFFRDYLVEKGKYYYDINSLHSQFFVYDRKYTPITIRKQWANFLKDNKGKKILKNIDLYIHIPFCRSICSFCTFPSWPLKKSETLDEYVDYLIGNMKFFWKTFEPVTFRCLVMGGGTPNLLTHKQMNRLLSALFDYFKFSRDGMRSCEFSPMLAEQPKLELMNKFGFNRISFGVQSLNPETLAANNRGYQRYKEIEKMISIARKSGFVDINVDLIAGFPTDSLEDFVRSFIGLAKLSPSSIMVNSLNPPNLDYMRKHFNLSYREYYQKHYPKTMKAILKKIIPIADKLGYYPNSSDLGDYHWKFHNEKEYPKNAMKDKTSNQKKNMRYSGEFSAHVPSSTLGLGIFSRSHIHSLLKYRQVSHSGRFDSNNEIFMGKELTKRDEMLKFVLISMERKSQIDLKLFKKTFGRNIVDIYPYTISVFADFRITKTAFESITFKFKKPEDKYVYALFFVYETIITKKEFA